MRLQGLKFHISVTLVMVLTLGMLLVIFVTTTLWQSDVLRSEVIHFQRITKLAVLALGNEVDSPNSDERTTSDALREYLAETEADCMIMQRADSEPVVVPPDCHAFEKIEKDIQQVFQSGQIFVHVSPPGRNILFPQKHSIIVVSPVEKQDKRIAIVGIIASTKAISESFVENRNIILVYFVINILILTVIGFFRLAKYVIKPIEKLVELTDLYSDNDTDDVSFLSLPEKNEFGRLSSSLNRMLQRIETDREKLRATVGSLENVNRQLISTQQEMVRTEKMASVGRLAAGLAHEIGNPLGIIQGYLELLQGNDLDVADKKDFIGRAEKELNRISSLIRQLLDFSRHSVHESSIISVHELLFNLIDMVRIQSRMKGVQVNTDLRAEPDTVYADANQLQQVFLNCLLNAADAIGENHDSEGRIDISTTLVSLQTVDRLKRTFLQVEIQDNGIGIAATDLSAVFDPFFTTKEPGKGTGLGLSVSHGIIENMGGSILAASEKGRGTTLTVNLPVSD